MINSDWTYEIPVGVITHPFKVTYEVDGSTNLPPGIQFDVDKGEFSGKPS